MKFPRHPRRYTVADIVEIVFAGLGETDEAIRQRLDDSQIHSFLRSLFALERPTPDRRYDAQLLDTLQLLHALAALRRAELALRAQIDEALAQLYETSIPAEDSTPCS